MGEHSVGTTGVKAFALDAAAFVWAHRRKVGSAVLVALPFVARYFPGFPTDEVVRVVRLFLGA
jgi:hypothetical protein